MQQSLNFSEAKALINKRSKNCNEIKNKKVKTDSIPQNIKSMPLNERQTVDIEEDEKISDFIATAKSKKEENELAKKPKSRYGSW